MSRTVLVSGASGYIGSSLTNYLDANNFECVSLSRKPLSCIGFLPGKLISHDLLSNDELFEERDHNISAIIHCASTNNILATEPEKALDLTINGTRKLLDYAVKKKVKDFIYLSTFQVYGTEVNGLITEDVFRNVETDYAYFHSCAEDLCFLYSKKFDLNITIVRPTNVFGFNNYPTVSRDTLVPTCFAKRIHEDSYIYLNSTGNQVRNFISLNSLSSAIMSLLTNTQRVSSNKVVNLGSELYLSIKEVAELVLERYTRLTGLVGELRINKENHTSRNEFTISRSEIIPPSRKETLIEMIKCIDSNIQYERESNDTGFSERVL